MYRVSRYYPNFPRLYKFYYFLKFASRWAMCIIKACRKIIWCRQAIEITFHGYTHIPRSTLVTCTARLCENLFAWDIRHAFSILSRECNVGSFDLANEPTFKLSATQMVMIIIIIWSSVSGVPTSSLRARRRAYQYTHTRTHLMNSRVRHIHGYVKLTTLRVDCGQYGARME